MFKEILIDLMNTSCNGSQKNLSQKTSIPTSTISSWITRGSTPTLNQLIILADFFKCSIDYLAEREDDFGNIQAKNNPNLTPEQAELLEYFDKVNSKLQNQIIGFAKGIAQRYERININSRIN
jgi:transcriptional regulator with XRE-family HTH domain